MSPLIRLALVLVSSALVAGASSAQAAKARATAAAAPTVSKPLKLTPARGASSIRIKAARPTRAGRRHFARHRARLPEREPALASAVALPLTDTERDTIYRIITERPLRPNPVPTERVLPPNTTGSAPARQAPPAEPEAIDDDALKVGGVAPPALPLHPIPVGAVAVVPEIEPFRYAFVGERVLLVDPRNGRIVATINQ